MVTPPEIPKAKTVTETSASGTTVQVSLYSLTFKGTSKQNSRKPPFFAKY